MDKNIFFLGLLFNYYLIIILNESETKLLYGTYYFYDLLLRSDHEKILSRIRYSF